MRLDLSDARLILAALLLCTAVAWAGFKLAETANDGWAVSVMADWPEMPRYRGRAIRSKESWRTPTRRMRTGASNSCGWP